RHFLAVVELDALAQEESPGRRIRILPSLGHERRLREVRSAEIDELIEEMPLELHADHAVVAIRIEATGIRRQRDLPLRLGLALRDETRSPEQKNGEDAKTRRGVAPPIVCHRHTSS